MTVSAHVTLLHEMLPDDAIRHAISDMQQKFHRVGWQLHVYLTWLIPYATMEFCCTVFNIFAREIIICHCYHISNIVWIALVNGSAGTVASCRLKNSCCMGLPWRKLIAQRIVSCGSVALTVVWCNYLFIFVLQLHILLNISLWSSTYHQNKITQNV